MHLRYPDAFGDLGLGHVREESKLEHGLLAFGQRRQEWANGFGVEHLVQIGVKVAETSGNRSAVVVIGGRRGIGRQGGVCAGRNNGLQHLFARDN